MTNARSFVKILILLGICGYAVVSGLNALVHEHEDEHEHTHEHEPLSRSCDECTACFYQAHHISFEIDAFELVLPNRRAPVPTTYEPVALSFRQNDTPLIRAPPSLPVHNPNDIFLINEA